MNVEHEARLVKADGLEFLVMENRAQAYDTAQPHTLYAAFVKILSRDKWRKGIFLNTDKLSRRLGLSGNPVVHGSKADNKLNKALAASSEYNVWAGQILKAIFGVARGLGTLAGLSEKELISSGGILRHNIERALNYGNARGEIGIARVMVDGQAYIFPSYRSSLPPLPRYSPFSMVKSLRAEVPI